MRIVLTQNTRVNYPAGTVVDVSEAEALRLIAFGLGVEAEPDKKPAKKSKK